jgi:hypothetical protein
MKYGVVGGLVCYVTGRVLLPGLARYLAVAMEVVSRI